MEQHAGAVAVQRHGAEAAKSMTLGSETVEREVLGRPAAMNDMHAAVNAAQASAAS